MNYKILGPHFMGFAEKFITIREYWSVRFHEYNYCEMKIKSEEDIL